MDANDIGELRKKWIRLIPEIPGDFKDKGGEILRHLRLELRTLGDDGIRAHLLTCGAIPESYGHDSTEEKVYSKYTDIILSLTFEALGFKSKVLDERSDFADVDVFASDYSFVSDAKSFRLSRTAKNQKDFKVQSMNRWKHGKPYAMVVCPVYQLPNSQSQIYIQATSLNVSILTYEHLSFLLSVKKVVGVEEIHRMVERVLGVTSLTSETKSAEQYWRAVNVVLSKGFSGAQKMWEDEMKLGVEVMELQKEIGLNEIRLKREEILRMTHEEAIRELIRYKKIDSQMNTVSGVKENSILQWN